MRIMKTIGSITAVSLALAVGMLAGNSKSGAQNAPPAMAMPMPASRAVAVIFPTKGNTISGTIWFDSTPHGVHIHGTVEGLPPNTAHGFHIHEYGDMTSPDAMAAGGHYNPEGHPHGGPGPMPHQAGDLGNVKADATGKGTVDLVVPEVTLDGKFPILGRSIVVHVGEDDMTPKANPGARMGMGVIGLAKPQ
jgi:Cu-Zn family superoxide dismutase